MKIDSYGRVTITEQEAFEALYTGQLTSLADVVIDGDIQRYNQARQQNADPIPTLEPLEDLSDTTIEFFDEANQCDWFMPDEYKEFPLVH